MIAKWYRDVKCFCLPKVWWKSSSVLRRSLTSLSLCLEHKGSLSPGVLWLEIGKRWRLAPVLRPLKWFSQIRPQRAWRHLGKQLTGQVGRDADRELWKVHAVAINYSH